jgi:hypothetical protein
VRASRPDLRGPWGAIPAGRSTRDRDSPRRRRHANHGGIAQADEQVRPDGPPVEDTLGAVPTAPGRRLRTRGTGPTRSDDIRFFGIYALLGTISASRMGGQTKDGEEPTQASDLLICGILMWSLIRFDLRSFDWLL